MYLNPFMLFLQQTSDIGQSAKKLFEELIIDIKDNPARYALAFAALSFIVATLNFFYTHIWPRLKAIYDSYSLRRQLGNAYTNQEIKDSLWYYIEPFVQTDDPSKSNEPQATVNIKSNLFTVFDEIFSEESAYRYTVLLADAGMGKTSALMSYTARHIRKVLKKYKVKLIPLGRPGVDEKIKKIEDKQDTVLLLDAFDEDTLAIKNHRQRLSEIMTATHEFRRVLISCRTQFFSKDEEIPYDPGILKVGARAAGESATYTLHRLYLSPFKKEQARLYLRRRYPIFKFKWRKRLRAFRMVRKVEHLAARPMLLAHIDVLITTPKNVSYAYEIYEKMVQAWLDREEGFITDKGEMRRFSELLAVELFLNRHVRLAEHIPHNQLTKLATAWGVPIKKWKFADWQLKSRALLNRDAEGNYKFAHRSILEYLFVIRFTKGDRRCLKHEWTDQMLTFYWEMVEHGLAEQRKLWFYNEKAPRLNEFSTAHEIFFKTLVLHGLSQLKTPAVAAQKMKLVLETATALCGFLLDPHDKDDPILSLYKVDMSLDNNLALSPIAIYYRGKLLDTNNIEGLRKSSAVREPALYADRIPNIDSPEYPKVLKRLKRVSSDESNWSSAAMPIKRWGKPVGILISETSREFAFEDDRHLLLIDILRVMGRYLWEYR